MNNYYLITANNKPPFNAVNFHNFVTSLYPKYFFSWWHYLQGTTYIVYTSLNENQIFNLLKTHMNDHHFLVIKVDPTTAQGWLPKQAWTWLGR